MKKIILVILIVNLVVFGSFNTYAFDNTGDNIFYYPNDVEIFISGENISYEKQVLIADYIANGENDNGISVCGIACIFGHKKDTKTVFETTHNAYSTSPKCLVEEFEVTYCTRSSCDYIEGELVDSHRISDCHG